jgi:hypothetical protein
MIRRAAALVFLLTMHPALLHAQTTALTVSVPSADVYKGPSTGSPIIGHVSRGAVLPVTRDLGSWVKVYWPDAQDGIGYVHVTMGHLGPPPSNSPAPRSGAGPAAEPVTTSIPPMTRTAIGERVAPRGQLQVTPASHIVGIGGLFASARSVGATARAWHGNRIGVQIGFLRDAQTSAAVPGRVTTLGFEPGIVVALFDRVSDYVWFRPYVGSTLTISRQTLTAGTAIPAEPLSQTRTGYRAFGGGEFTFANMPRFGLSADLGYRQAEGSFDGFPTDHLSLAVAGHWYVK